MKIESIFTDKDGYKFRIDGTIILEIAGTAIPSLNINFPSSGSVEKYYQSVREQFNIEKMVNDILEKNSKVSKIIIDSEVCRADDIIFFQTNDLEKYKL